MLRYKWFDVNASCSLGHTYGKGVFSCKDFRVYIINSTNTAAMYLNTPLVWTGLKFICNGLNGLLLNWLTSNRLWWNWIMVAPIPWSLKYHDLTSLFFIICSSFIPFYKTFWGIAFSLYLHMSFSIIISISSDIFFCFFFHFLILISFVLLSYVVSLLLFIWSWCFKHIVTNMFWLFSSIF